MSVVLLAFLSPDFFFFFKMTFVEQRYFKRTTAPAGTGKLRIVPLFPSFTPSYHHLWIVEDAESLLRSVFHYNKWGLLSGKYG